MIKKTVEELAFLGGKPAFPKALFVGSPNAGSYSRFQERLGDIFERRWFTNDGRYVKELEASVAGIASVDHCVAVANGTLGLQLAMATMELSGEVIVPSFTFVATAHAMLWGGLRPVFCDVDPHTHNIDPAAVERLITPETTAVLGVHLWGRPCAIEELEAITERHALKLFFDSAHAFHCTHQGKPVGGFGTAEVLSFHATKFFHTFEGGAILTNDSCFAERLRLARNFGFAGYDKVVSLGINAKMNEVSAAMGLTLLEDLPAILERNERNFQRYSTGIKCVAGISLSAPFGGDDSNYQYIVLELEEGLVGGARDTLVESLQAENVIARRYFFPGCHSMEPYRSDPFYQAQAHSLENTESLAQRVLVMPNGPELDENAIDTICSLIRLVVENLDAIQSRKQSLV